ncbi:Homeobox-leucine zipper protein ANTHOCYANINLESS 2 [Acorus calamus]|uniref:Homeobox-leucine zipper protein ANTHOCYANINLESS 2 n=1 Tax=Acorus calamus TaxID=4465 RepID=A0AAV9DUV4_ACOCL|nr:Homeobox-leucine zipper protein ANTHOCYANINLESS 2 [Acorus calamus]
MRYKGHLLYNIDQNIHLLENEKYAPTPSLVVNNKYTLSLRVFTFHQKVEIKQTNMDGVLVHRQSGDFDFGGPNREEEYESRSGSDNIEGGSDDELDPDEPPSKKKKRYHRHTPQQIQELEALFKECPHPDEKQRLELSRRLSLETRQVKFWFQNRRTQMKVKSEEHHSSNKKNVV